MLACTTDTSSDFEIAATSEHRNFSGEVLHVRHGDRELTADGVPRRRRRWILPIRWRRVREKNERTGFGKTRGVVRVRLCRDAISGMPGPVIERASRLYVHIGNRPKEQPVSIKWTSDDGR